MRQKINKLLLEFNLSIEDFTPLEIEQIEYELNLKESGKFIFDGRTELIIKSKFMQKYNG